jgi:hypothetical protein
MFNVPGKRRTCAFLYGFLYALVQIRGHEMQVPIFADISNNAEPCRLIGGNPGEIGFSTTICRRFYPFLQNRPGREIRETSSS